MERVPLICFSFINLFPNLVYQTFSLTQLLSRHLAQ